MTRTRRAGRPIDEQGEAILRAAEVEFRDRGFRPATIRAIARGAGVPEGTLRQYFPDKKELFREVVRSRMVELLRGANQWQVPREGTWNDRLIEWQRRFGEAMRAPEAAMLRRWYREDFAEFPELTVFYQVEIIGRAVTEVERLVGKGNGGTLVERTLFQEHAANGHRKALT
jgi:AcrR family transcriptional regulator